jgi:hypothetical protein
MSPPVEYWQNVEYLEKQLASGDISPAFAKRELDSLNESYRGEGVRLANWERISKNKQPTSMKRQRSGDGYVAKGRSTPAQRGAWASGKFSRVKPWSTWGAMRVQRGTPENLDRFGQSFKTATQAQRDMRKALGYTGRGMYTGRGKKLSGRGEYSMSNELIAGSTSSPPVFQSAGDEAGALMISHREYVGDIFAPASAVVSDFTVQSFPLNPGLEQTFPWLSQIAQNYEEYELKQCVFEFVSTVQDINSTNGQVGTIITATQYNPSRPDFTDKPAMAAYAHSVSGKSTDNQTHGVECDPMKLSGAEGKFVRANPVMTGEDLKTYDHGRFQLATHNIPSAMASGTLGELYVQYTVCLRKPKFFTGRGLGLTRYLEVCDADTSGAIAFTKPFGDDGDELVGKQNNLKLSIVKNTNETVITFPAYYGGRLRLTFKIEGTSIAGGMASFAVAGNVSFVSDLYSAGGKTADNPDYRIGIDTAEGCIAILSVNVEPATNATDNTLTVTHSLTAGVINQSFIDCTEYNTFQSLGAPELVNAAGTAVIL